MRFRKFSKLPNELREVIWKYAANRSLRVLEIKPIPSNCAEGVHYVVHFRCSLLHVNRRARSVALSELEKDQSQLLHEKVTSTDWMDYERSIIHLKCTSSFMYRSQDDMFRVTRRSAWKSPEVSCSHLPPNMSSPSLMTRVICSPWYQFVRLIATNRDALLNYGDKLWVTALRNYFPRLRHLVIFVDNRFRKMDDVVYGEAYEDVHNRDLRWRATQIESAPFRPPKKHSAVQLYASYVKQKTENEIFEDERCRANHWRPVVHVLTATLPTICDAVAERPDWLPEVSTSLDPVEKAARED